jgi:hypothetical protein
MGIVTATRLNRFLSSPTWTESLTDEAAQLCDEVESTLGDRLATYITPVPFTEQVAVLQTGLVATRHPVASVNTINGVTVTGVLPAPWRIQEGRLRWTDTGNFPPLGNPEFSLLGGWSPLGVAPRVQGIGSVALNYMAGWGDLDTLRLAILRKLGVIWLNRHDDTIMARNMDSQSPPPLPSEEWTDAELAPLGVFRNLAAWR